MTDKIWRDAIREADKTHDALRKAFVALRHVEDWQWGKREPDLREDQILSADTVRPMVAEAIATIKNVLGDDLQPNDLQKDTPA